MAHNTFKAIDTVITHQALITGQVTDGLSGRPTLHPPTVELHYQTPVDQPVRRYPLTGCLIPGGFFVFTGMPATAFPRLSPGGTLDLRLIVSAARYQPQTIDFTLSDTDLALIERLLQIGERTATASVLDAPLLEQNVALLPEPLHLGGRVVSADDPETPIPNAEVRVVAPEVRGPVLTNSGGYFTLSDMPVAEEITVRVSAPPNFKQQEIMVRLDYRQPVNDVTFALSPNS